MTDEKTLREKLREPLPPEAIKPHPTKSYMSSINSAYIVERLNDCFGESGWVATYQVMEASPSDRMVVVRCDFKSDEYGIERHCFGGNDNPDRGDAYKGACTDALGKVASQLGIGAEVYKGMLDKEIQPEQERKGRKPPKEQYGAIDGIVNRCEMLNPHTLWLLVDQTKVRVMGELQIKQLQNAMGKRVELTCRWEKTKDQRIPFMTVTNVLGVYEAVPSQPTYERIMSKCFKHGDYQGEGNCPKCETENDLTPMLAASVKQAKERKQ